MAFNRLGVFSIEDILAYDELMETQPDGGSRSTWICKYLSSITDSSIKNMVFINSPKYLNQNISFFVDVFKSVVTELNYTCFIIRCSDV